MSLLSPTQLWSRREVLERQSPVPKSPGVYAWFFRNIPAQVPQDGCVIANGLTLLYVGISPKAIPMNGKPASSQTLWHRIRYHFRGNAEGSTLRLTLGCLLGSQLGIELRRVGSGKRLTFGPGEATLSQWMEENAFVTWQVDAEPWKLERQLIGETKLPLNLDMNSSHVFHRALSGLRREARERARQLPILL